MKIGIVGATGIVGREVVSRLAEVSDELREEVLGVEAPLLFATGQNAGESSPGATTRM